MLPKNNGKEDSSNLDGEKSKQLQGETHGDSLQKSLTIIGMIFFAVIITWTLFWIESIPSKPKLLAWCSQRKSIVEIETQQESANFDGVKLNPAGCIF